MDLTFHTLPNGIRMIHCTTVSEVAYCGIIINAGSRDELPDEHGIAHFIEHMFFKGTTKRKAYHILSRLEDVGGELNAYTTKEETAVYASFMREHYPRAVEILADIVFSSSFPVIEIEKEKEVVIEEINSYLDSPAEYIFDEFEEQVFSGQPIGRNILGERKTIRHISRKKLIEFISRNYSTDQIVFCSTGKISPREIIRQFEKYFSHIPSRTGEKREIKKYHYSPVSAEKKKNTCQNHCIIGNIAFDLHDKRRMGLFVLNNILGGQGLNSRLNLMLREKRGYAYNVESMYNPYTDTGLFSIYFGTDSRNLEKCIDLTHKELKRLCNDPLGPRQLHKARNQIKGYLLRSYDNHENMMLSLGKSLLIFERIESIEEIFKKIDSVTSAELKETASVIFNESSLSTLVYK
jgi:predicted Zn-dependent peptidase